ncbi:MAG TPA: hypothetical protein VNO50_09510 [Pyrinomonadaceae bacterium]|nr:hypothetical protein [Pyrinomonadaceae bacterium]
MTSFAKLVIILSLICYASGAAVAQERTQSSPQPSASPRPTPAPETPAAIPAANPADVVSMDAIIAALYDVISGPAGKKRDWDRMRSLFVPGARLIPSGPRPSGGYGTRVGTVEDYITRSAPYLESQGFFETEIARKTDAFGNIAHVFSTYDSRHKADDAKPFARGINSIQLMNDGKRWWIVTVFWQGEDEKNPLPERYPKSN